MAENWQDAIERARKHATVPRQWRCDRLPELEALLAAGRGRGSAGMGARRGRRRSGCRHRAAARAAGTCGGAGDGRSCRRLPAAARDARAVRLRRPGSGCGDRRRASGGACPMRSPPASCALALGKQGARELNYSSDIDPILLYDPATLPRRERDDPGEAAQRVARAMVETLSNQTSRRLCLPGRSAAAARPRRSRRWPSRSTRR